MTIDHVIPRARGGSDAYQNRQPAHLQCNQWKADRTMDEVIGAACSLETRAEITTIVLHLYQEEIRELKRLYPDAAPEVAARCLVRGRLTTPSRMPER